MPPLPGSVSASISCFYRVHVRNISNTWRQKVAVHSMLHCTSDTCSRCTPKCSIHFTFEYPLSPFPSPFFPSHLFPSPFFPFPPSFLSSHLNRARLEQLVAEHLDHLHYISDIISLGMDTLNEIITDHLLNRLLIPLYVYSLTDMSPNAEGVRGFTSWHD